MAINVIIINGVGQCGKDTFIEYAGDFFFAKRMSVLNYSTVETPKDIGKEYFDADPNNKSEKNRQLWQKLKELLVWYDDIPLKEIEGIICDMKSAANQWGAENGKNLFIHCREPQEIKKIEDLCKRKDVKFISLLITRKEAVCPDNPSDKAVNNWNYDFHYSNDGSLTSLKDCAKTFCDSLSGA